VNDEGSFYQGLIERLARRQSYADIDPGQRGLVMLKIDGLMLNPYFLTRTIVFFVVDVVREGWQMLSGALFSLESLLTRLGLMRQVSLSHRCVGGSGCEWIADVGPDDWLGRRSAAAAIRRLVHTCDLRYNQARMIEMRTPSLLENVFTEVRV